MTTISIAKDAWLRRLEALQQDQRQQQRPDKAVAQDEARRDRRAPGRAPEPPPRVTATAAAAQQHQQQQHHHHHHQAAAPQTSKQATTSQKIAQLRDAERRRDGREQRRLALLTQRRAELALALAAAHRSRVLAASALGAWAEAAARQRVARSLEATRWHRQRLLARCLARLCAHAACARAARAATVAAGVARLRRAASERAASGALTTWRLAAVEGSARLARTRDALATRHRLAVWQAWQRRAAAEASSLLQPPRLGALCLVRRTFVLWRRNARARKDEARHLARAREVLAAIARESEVEGSGSGSDGVPSAAAAERF